MRQTDRQRVTETDIHRQGYKQAGMHTRLEGTDIRSHRQTYRKTYTHTDRRACTDRHTDRQTDRQTQTHTHTQTHIQAGGHAYYLGQTDRHAD